VSVTVTLTINGIGVPVELDDNALAVIAAAVTAKAEPNPQPEWLTINAASEYTGLSVAAVRKLIDRLGIDKHQEVKGGRVLIRRTDLDHALTTRRRTP
jgi:excisionase family DNA binding protein